MSAQPDDKLAAPGPASPIPPGGEAPEPAPQISRTYRNAMRVCTPVIRTWGRLEVSGAEVVPTTGPLLIVGNHDSHWDPVAVGVAGLDRRQIQALAKASLWKVPGLAPILNGMGQVPIHRGTGDRDALRTAIERLEAGECIGIFPEGTISRGKELRARSGVGRLAAAVPDTRLVCVAIRGTVDIVRFPKRPQISVEFFAPDGGQMKPGEDPADLAARLLAEIRDRAPVAVGGRKRKRERWLAAAAENRDPPNEGA